MQDARATPDHEPLIRQLTVLGVWGLAINGTIGAGIFGTPAAAAAATGIYSPLVFLLCGLLLAPVVLSFAEVASTFRGTGGPVLYAHTAFGPFVGFQTGWAYYVARVSASAANVSLIVATLAWFWERADEGMVRVAMLLLICGALTWVNLVGTRHAMRSVGWLTVLKFLPLVAVIAFGVSWIGPATFPFAATAIPTIPDWGSAVMLVIYAYVGWESALVPAGETRDPTRDMPRALLWALATAAVLYVAIQAVSIAVVPELAAAAERPLVAVGEVLFGRTGAVLIMFAVVASVSGNVASATMSTPRITYAMARSGLLPRVFGAVHAGWRTPAASILIYGAVMFALAATGSFVELAKVSVLTRLLIYLLVIGALPRLRERQVGTVGRFRLPGGYVIPIVAALICLWLLVQVSQDTVLRTAIYLAIGTALYLIARRTRARRA